MFETRSHAWKEVGLLRQIDRRAAKRAGVEGPCWCALFVAVVVLYDNRQALLGVDSRGQLLRSQHAGARSRR